MSDKRKPLYSYWQPRFWATWLVLTVLRLIVALPQPARMACGRGLGRLAMRLLRSRAKVAQRNLEICFPELPTDEIGALTRRHFESLGMGVIELGMAWWLNDKQLLNLLSVKGTEHITKALEQGKGVIMLSGHFAITEISGIALQPMLPPMAAMYRPSANPMNDQIMRTIRGRSVPDLITKKGIRHLIRVLKENRPVWYAADQAWEGKGAMLVPFFGEPAMTNTAISQICRLSNAAVIPFHPVRVDNGKRYEITYYPAMEGFPSGDAEADAIKINAFLEQSIRIAPEQYYWVHRRFKGRPDTYPKAYKV